MTKCYHYFCHPKTASEKRANGSFKADKRDYKIKGRIRTKGTCSRLADVWDDKPCGAFTNKYLGKRNHSAARKAKEREKGRQLAA